MPKNESPFNYLHLSKFLRNTLVSIRLIPSNPLLKLASIRNFGIIFTTAYDDFLAGVINNVRTTPLMELAYTIHEKRSIEIGYEFLKTIAESQSTLLVHIFGNRKNRHPAFTEIERNTFFKIVWVHKETRCKKLSKQSLIKKIFTGGGCFQ